MGNMFCFIDINDFSSVTVKSTPDEIETFRATHFSVSAPLNQSLRYWMQLDLGGDVSDTDIRNLTARAFTLVKTKYMPHSHRIKRRK